MTVTVVLEGFKETQERLRGFPEKLRKNYMRGGMRALVAQLRKGARRRIDRFSRTGALRRSIGVSTRAFADGTVIGKVYAGAVITSGKHKGRSAWYGHILESGAKPHSITPQQRKAIAFGGKVFAGAKHPGIKGRHFMRDTASQDIEHGRRIFTTYVETRSKAYLEGKSNA